MMRIGTYDTAKALLILLVILGHVLQYANPGYAFLPYALVQNWISSFHMPAFFLLSGYLF
ncbi:MAG: acyltransferase family protein, partial [Solobacterium sp.]|nr:acyltransferase family protein [Solobacterium sp.]